MGQQMDGFISTKHDPFHAEAPRARRPGWQLTRHDGPANRKWVRHIEVGVKRYGEVFM